MGATVRLFYRLVTRRPPHEVPELDTLLAPGASSDAVHPSWSAVTRVLKAAAAPPHPEEFADEQVFRAAFRRYVAARGRERNPAGRPAHRFSRRLVGATSGLATAAVALVTAAYASALPASLQSVAHRVIGAPAPNPASSFPTPPSGPSPSLTSPLSSATSSPSPTPSRPGETHGGTVPSPAATGLCTAWLAAVQAGHTPSGLRGQLTTLVGDDSTDHITAYCNTVLAGKETAPEHMPANTGENSGNPGDHGSPGNPGDEHRQNQKPESSGPTGGTENPGSDRGQSEHHGENQGPPASGSAES
ncbi:hypothetical protein [Acidothermus cellulolyticus]|uniref:hypothetical protein n=1 Tax=Acidothermus cellulolyticus TaxID=28049 RepID=UPI00067485BD|nr:hypothetical protein [Acidothermus cellulolyticus]